MLGSILRARPAYIGRRSRKRPGVTYYRPSVGRRNIASSVISSFIRRTINRNRPRPRGIPPPRRGRIRWNEIHPMTRRSMVNATRRRLRR